jgi:gamma-tubulin complex component 4
LGYLYATLDSFVEETSSDDSSGGGFYKAALANGISELLDVYRSAVLQIEQHLMKLQTPPLLSLQHFLSEFEILLPEVVSIVSEVQDRHIYGAAIPQLLDSHAHSGIPTLQSCAERLLWHCNQVMFKQLEAWLIHGVLINVEDGGGTGGTTGVAAAAGGGGGGGGEFFVQSCSCFSSSSSGAAAQGSGGGTDHFSSRAAGLRAHILGREPVHAAGALLDWQPLEWHTGFQISTRSLPPGVTLQTAETILFIGKAVRVLKQPMSAAVSAEALRAHTEILSFADALRRLKNADRWRQIELEALIEGMRTRVSTLLWNLVRHRCDLNGHFGGIKDYFLLGKGGFYQQLLDECQHLLALPPKLGTASADIALLFQTAAAKSGAENDAIFSSLRLQWIADVATRAPAWHPSRCDSVTVPGFDTWDGLYLECSIDWPLQLLFPPDILQKYGALWQFLFRLRRVHLKLEHSWATLSTLKPEIDLPGHIFSHLWQLRQKMTHFISNLQMYCHLDVVESSLSSLKEKVNTANDFSEAEDAHRMYVDSLITQTFLDMKQIAGLIGSLFHLCCQLYTLLDTISKAVIDGSVTTTNTATDHQNVDMDGIQQKADTIAREFKLKHNVLYQLMQSSKLQSGERAPALRQFILRMNYNEYVEKEALEHVRGTTAAGDGDDDDDE